MRYYHVSKLISLLQTRNFMIVVKFPFDNIVSLYCAYIYSVLASLALIIDIVRRQKYPTRRYIKFGKSQLFRNKTCFCPAVLFKAVSTPSEDGFFFEPNFMCQNHRHLWQREFKHWSLPISGEGNLTPVNKPANNNKVP